jgi:hypothetical protein
MGEQKQQVMPGIFMIQEQIMTDPFNPYFEYSVENGRTSGKRFELTIDFTMSTNVAVNGQAGFIVVTVVKPGERKLAAQVRAAHVDQAWGPQCGLKCRELADDDEGNATPEPGAVDLAEEDGEAAEVSFAEDPRTTKKTMIARDITLLEMSWPPKSGPAPRVAYCVRNYRAAHVDVVLDFRGSTNGAVRPLGEGEVGRNENFIQARAVAPVALAVLCGRRWNRARRAVAYVALTVFVVLVKRRARRAGGRTVLSGPPESTSIITHDRVCV